MKLSHKLTRSVLATLTLAAGLTLSATAQDTSYSPAGLQFPPPTCPLLHGTVGSAVRCSDQAYADWLADLTHWRTERRIRTGYDPSRYDLPALQWAQSAFIAPQMMVHDRFFYDPTAGKYTVDRYLADLEKRYGGIDAVLIWSTYPNMGIDDRNQLDMVRSMPGGVAGVRQMVADFHRHNVRVLFPLMMWDQGTHDPGQPWPDAIAALMKEIGADGINGDTQDGVPLTFTLAAEKIQHPLAFEPESAPSDEALAWNVLGWGYYQYQFIPQVDKTRWLYPRHQVHISDRWNHDHISDLQFAFFNGEGWVSWENVWGIWNGIMPRDAEATRRVATIERAVAPFFASPDWQPYYPMHQPGAFASRWPLSTQTLWTIVNRGLSDLDGPQLSVPFVQGTRYFDLYHGIELTPTRDGSNAILSFPIEAGGFGAVLALTGAPDAKIQQLLAAMKPMTAQPLASFDHQWKPLSQQLVPIAPTSPVASPPAGMVRIPAADFLFKVDGIEIEGSDNIGVDVQYPWEDSARRSHEHVISINTFYIDQYPITNADFKNFLDASHYHPADDLNFLKDWHNGTYPAGVANKPVTWVSLEDARAYAAWAGKRLPHEWEWQYAAQGADHRLYPWGDAWNSAAVPMPDKSRTLTAPDAVEAHPLGASPFGVMDMVGNVWQWTDEFADEHTRATILRGGSYYQPQGSKWYFPQAYRNDQHGKLLLMAPSYDRSGTVGFRCVQDATP